MKPIYEIIKPALIEAADDCMITLQKENAEYRLCMEKYSDYMNQLKGELTSEQRRLLLRIDTLKNEISVIELEKMYERGRVDTVGLLKMLQVI